MNNLYLLHILIKSILHTQCIYVKSKNLGFDPLPVDRGTRDGDLFDLGELEEASKEIE